MTNFLKLLYLSILPVLLFSCSKKTTTPPPPDLPPGCTTNISPANSSFVTGTTITFSWSSVTAATAYDVYLGTTSNPSSVIASNISATSYTYTLPATSTSTTYYWYVQPKNANGTASGCIVGTTSFTALSITAPPSLGYYVVGYMPSYRNITAVPDVKFRMTNVVVYAFYQVNATGNLAAPAAATSTLSAVATKAKVNGSKILLGINEASSGYFKNMAASAAGRNNFIKEVMNNVRTNSLDGVDVDWEFPSTSDGTDVTFTALMKELSDSLHRDGRYYLSCAITAGKYAGGIRDAVRNEIFTYVDFFNIMAYDDFSTSSTELYRQHSDYTLATVCLSYWINTRGMPAAKAVLGVPAYGRPSGISQSGNVVTYSGIISQGGNPLYDSAMVTTTTTPTPFKVYYNGQYTTKRKAKLAKDMAGGVMFWEKGQDVMDNNSLLKAACDTVGRSY
jgi:GH18 family chitinase